MNQRPNDVFDDEVSTDWEGFPLYGYVENRHDVDEDGRTRSWWIVDAIRETSAASLRTLEFSEMPPLPTIQLAIEWDYDSSIPPEIAALTEGAWGRFELGSGDLPVRVFQDLDGEGSTERTVRFLGSLPPSDELKLRAFFTTDNLPKASAIEIHDALNVPQVASHLAVYAVGQGNANAVCVGKERQSSTSTWEGGCLWNAKTYAKVLRFCFSFEPPIVLSHWDFDHWFSATKIPLQGTTWVVPIQDFGARTHAFVSKLVNSRARVLVWPSHLGNLKLPWGHLVRCTGTTKNDSGLALFVETSPGDYVLAPGDAQFQFIPSPFAKSQPLAGIVGTHHGSAHTGSPIPSPSPSRTGQARSVAYSYGGGNKYGHPSAIARGLYVGEGWAELETTSGSIALPDSTASLSQGAVASNCDLLLKQ